MGFENGMEEAGVVLGVGPPEELVESVVDVVAVGEGEKPAGGFDAAVLADAEEDDAVDDELDGVVELPGGEIIMAGQVLSKIGALLFQLF